MSGPPRKARVPREARPGTRGAVRAWALVTLVAQPLVVIGWLVAALWQDPRYSSVDHSISDMLAVGAPRAGFLVVVLALYGAVVIVFALLPLRSALRPAGPVAPVGSVLLSLSFFGLAELLAPLERFPCQTLSPGCTLDVQVAGFGGRLDETMSILGIACTVAGGLVLASAMERTPGWRRWARPARGVTVALAVLFLAEIISAFSLDGLGAGLLERVAFAVGAAGVGALAVGVLRSPTPR